MNACKGQPAEKHALAYVDGSLPESESVQFEEHFFECSECLAQVQALQDVREQLSQHRLEVSAAMPTVQKGFGAKIRTFFQPRPIWGVAAFASLLLIAVVIARTNWRVQAPTHEAINNAAQNPATEAEKKTAAAGDGQKIEPAGKHTSFAQLADLALPVFVAPSLRDESGDAHFLGGMKAYSAGDCSKALNSLAQVPAAAREAHAARFYAGACEVQLGNYSAAKKDLHAVVDAGDSPELESALYALAQVSLAENDALAARQYLLKTIALRGDLEAKARNEDAKVVALMNQGHAQARGDQLKPQDRQSPQQ